MPKPRPPSRIEPLSFPVFGLTWYVNPGNGSSWIAYCGGGGSAKTGVNNSVVIMEGGTDAPRQVNTGSSVGVALHIYQNPISNKLWLIVALSRSVVRFSLPDCQEAGTIEVPGMEEGDMLNAIAVDAMAEHVAVGCDSGVIKMFEISDDVFDSSGTLFTLQGHTKSVCSLAFSSRGQRLVSSAKDGTACIWKDGNRIGGLRCSIDDGSEAAAKKAAPPPNKRPPQVLVRGCAFGDLDGKIIYTVASGRRGSAFLARWVETDQRKFACESKDKCSPDPVSAMNLAADGNTIALGATNGSIILWDTEKWKATKVFKEVHELPVTAIAARPFLVPIKGEEDEVQIHARSVSADNQLACLTLQRRVPKKKGQASSEGGGFGFMSIMHFIAFVLKTYIVLLLLSPVVREAREKCETTWRDHHSPSALAECLLHKVLIAPANTPGVASPPI